MIALSVQNAAHVSMAMREAGAIAFSTRKPPLKTSTIPSSPPGLPSWVLNDARLTPAESADHRRAWNPEAASRAHDNRAGRHRRADASRRPGSAAVSVRCGNCCSMWWTMLRPQKHGSPSPSRTRTGGRSSWKTTIAGSHQVGRDNEARGLPKSNASISGNERRRWRTPGQHLFPETGTMAVPHDPLVPRAAHPWHRSYTARTRS